MIIHLDHRKLFSLDIECDDPGEIMDLASRAMARSTGSTRPLMASARIIDGGFTLCCPALGARGVSVAADAIVKALEDGGYTVRMTEVGDFDIPPGKAAKLLKSGRRLGVDMSAIMERPRVK